MAINVILIIEKILLSRLLNAPAIKMPDINGKNQN